MLAPNTLTTIQKNLKGRKYQYAYFPFISSNIKGFKP